MQLAMIGLGKWYTTVCGMEEATWKVADLDYMGVV